MLELFPQDIFRTLCQNLNIPAINTLTFVSKTLRSNILNDNIFWKNEFNTNFPHRIEKIIQNGEPSSWYLVFEKTYIEEYGFNDTNIEEQKEASDKAALFTAAKRGDAAEFSRLLGKKVIEIKRTKNYNTEAAYHFLFFTVLPNLKDYSGYRCYDWLYQKGFQNI